MLGRNRRFRFLLIVVLGVLTFLFFLRSSVPRAEQVENLQEKIVGGGAALRAQGGNEIPLVPEPEPLARPEPPQDGAKGDGFDADVTTTLPETPSTTDASESLSSAEYVVPHGEGQGLGQGRLEITVEPSTTIYWSRVPEHFPITSTIQLPTGTPKAIPRVQNDTKLQENGEDKEKLKAIRDTAKLAWKGYRDVAWGHDEVMPVSGHAVDPFNGWGATLVDSLDTLWIMGLKDDFIEAVEKVKQIDFTTSPRADIPMFEVTIRYLGGLLAAYDISDHAYRALLDKAVELAEILYGAFDTPNRMPQMYYQWRPKAQAVPKRASERVVLAELGSLSMEFTRLAQLTGEPKYYDAIARITNAFEEFQLDTQLPGLWPQKIDASGCERKRSYLADMPGTPVSQHGHEMPLFAGDEAWRGSGENAEAAEAEKAAKDLADSLTSGQGGKAVAVDPGGSIVEEKKADDKKAADKKADEDFLGSLGSSKKKRDESGNTIAVGAPLHPDEGMYKLVECTPHGLDSPSRNELYTLGSASDSTYEYLPKQYLLLGGHADEYRKMYLRSADPAIEKLLYKPMTPTDADILMSGSLALHPDQAPNASPSSLASKFDPEAAHLTCFTGGMFLLAGAIFSEPKHIDIGAKLTDGCVWAYNSTVTGIMPENGSLLPCPDTFGPCPWNETAYWDALDPYAFVRLRHLPKTDPDSDLLDETNSRIVPRHDPQNLTPDRVIPEFDDDEIHMPPTPASHRDFVQSRLITERLPLGFTNIASPQYLLRPEAIESVWYAYRITGDLYWREVAWRMFLAVDEYTKAEYGNSAIYDVTLPEPTLKDSAESFWIGETLKYFYLIFAAPDVVSLDEWVLNTEAHPFRRPSFRFKGE